MNVAIPTRSTWRAVVGDAVGPARTVVDLEGAEGQWRALLELNGYLLMLAEYAPRHNLHGAVIARHLVSRVAEPDRLLAQWFERLDAGGRIVLLECAPPRRRFRPARLIFPPRQEPDRAAPYRQGLSLDDATLLLTGTGFTNCRTFALPGPPNAGAHYLVSARRP